MANTLFFTPFSGSLQSRRERYFLSQRPQRLRDFFQNLWEVNSEKLPTEVYLTKEIGFTVKE